MLTEAAGCRVLKSLFESAGYKIAEMVRLAEGGLDMVVDGWDAEKRVGYHFLLGERPEMHERHLAELESRIEAAHLHLLLIDEMEAVDESHLQHAAQYFIQAVKER
ncbi:MAG: hypothetical protein ACYCW6_01910 [Candidatus Xenobia bacterium]